MFTFIRDFLGKCIGYIELYTGWTYPVKHYVSRVDERLYRGSRQDLQGLMKLHDMGVTAVIDLRAEGKGDEGWCGALGINHLRIPIIDNTAPTRDQVLDVIDFINTNQLTYIHCQAGIFRTGTVVACYRISTGWSKEAALKEAAIFGQLLTPQLNFVQSF